MCHIMSDSLPNVNDAAGFGTPLRDIWYAVALASTVRAGTMQRIILANQPLAVGRTHTGEAFAVRDICPHRAAKLSTGRVCSDNTIECPYHGWRFNAGNGACSRIPALGNDANQTASRFKLWAHPTHEAGGLIWVYLASDARRHLPPCVPPPVLPAACTAKPLLFQSITLNCGIDDAVVGLMDPAHGPFVHQSFFWRNKKSIHAKHKQFEPTPRGFAMCRHSPSRNAAAYKILGGDMSTCITFTLPGLRIEEIDTPKGTVVSLTALLPHTPPNAPATTTLLQVFYSNFTFLKLIKPLLHLAVRHFLRQDAGIMQQQAQNTPFAPRMMLLDDADTQAKWYYKLRREHDACLRDNRAFINPVPPTTLHWYS